MISDTSKGRKAKSGQPDGLTHEPEVGNLEAFHETEDEFSGIELAVYASRHKISEREVWDKIRSGELIGRSFGGKLYIHEQSERLSGSSLHELPPLPELEGATSHPNPDNPQNLPEVALLLDHLSLAKEENKEILKLTQDSISRITKMTDTIVAMKDELLKAKETQIDSLQEKITSRDSEISRLKQEVEDLRMLTASLAKEQPSPLE